MRIGSSHKYDGLYYLDDNTLHFGLAAISFPNTPLQWHRRLGHHLQKLHQVLSIEPSIIILDCESCWLGKHHAFYPSRIVIGVVLF